MQEDVPRSIEAWDDGFEPGTVSLGQTMVRYEKRHKECVRVYEDVLDEGICDKMYEYAVRQGKPWGVYLSFETIKKGNFERLKEEERFAAEAIAALFLERCSDLVNENEMHGVAVWCLASDVGAQVQYHLDYAELHRYETGEIVPPFYGGTLALSPLKEHEIQGGALWINLNGLEHYRQCGYKERLAKIDLSDRDWRRVGYAKNRAIIFDGELPHLAEKTTFLPDNKKRVILGFNVFGHRVKAANQRAPEHSSQFNTTVKLYQSLGGSRTFQEKQKLDLVTLSRPENKSFARLLVGLARKHLDHTSSETRSSCCSSSLKPGDRVSARWRRGLRYWPATIAAIHSDGLLDLHYDDGTRWPGAPLSSVMTNGKKLVPAAS